VSDLLPKVLEVAVYQQPVVPATVSSLLSATVCYVVPSAIICRITPRLRSQLAKSIDAGAEGPCLSCTLSSVIQDLPFTGWARGLILRCPRCSPHTKAELVDGLCAGSSSSCAEGKAGKSSSAQPHLSAGSMRKRFKAQAPLLDGEDLDGDVHPPSPTKLKGAAGHLAAPEAAHLPPSPDAARSALPDTSELSDATAAAFGLLLPDDAPARALQLDDAHAAMPDVAAGPALVAAGVDAQVQVLLQRSAASAAARCEASTAALVARLKSSKAQRAALREAAAAAEGGPSEPCSRSSLYASKARRLVLSVKVRLTGGGGGGGAGRAGGAAAARLAVLLSAARPVQGLHRLTPPTPLPCPQVPGQHDQHTFASTARQMAHTTGVVCRQELPAAGRRLLSANATFFRGCVHMLLDLQLQDGEQEAAQRRPDGQGSSSHQGQQAAQPQESEPALARLRSGAASDSGGARPDGQPTSPSTPPPPGSSYTTGSASDNELHAQLLGGAALDSHLGATAAAHQLPAPLFAHGRPPLSPPGPQAADARLLQAVHAGVQAAVAPGAQAAAYRPSGGFGGAGAAGFGAPTLQRIQKLPGSSDVEHLLQEHRRRRPGQLLPCYASPFCAPLPQLRLPGASAPQGEQQQEAEVLRLAMVVPGLGAANAAARAARAAAPAGAEGEGEADGGLYFIVLAEQQGQVQRAVLCAAPLRACCAPGGPARGCAHARPRCTLRPSAPGARHAPWHTPPPLRCSPRSSSTCSACPATSWPSACLPTACSLACCACTCWTPTRPPCWPRPPCCCCPTTPARPRGASSTPACCARRRACWAWARPAAAPRTRAPPESCMPLCSRSISRPLRWTWRGCCTCRAAARRAAGEAEERIRPAARWRRWLWTGPLCARARSTWSTF
jgi:hypothetical protein